MNKKRILLTILCAVLAIIIPSATVNAATNNDYCILPPFITSDVNPNLLLMIDNSASMNELAYTSPVATSYCYDDTYSDDNSYAGYFEQDNYYEFNSGLANDYFTGITSLAGLTCNYQTSYLCVDINNSGQVLTFAASGKFLNWLTASKIDIEKEILTGGKYDPADQVLIAETRGCMGVRSLKAVPGIALTFGIRGPDLVADTLALSVGGQTYIDIFEGTADISQCLYALELLASGKKWGPAREAIEDCLGITVANSPRYSAYVRSIQACWTLAKWNIDYIRSESWPWQVATNCKVIYDSGIRPEDITADDIDYICSDSQLPERATHYIGQCWVDEETLAASPDFTGNGDYWNDACWEEELVAFCTGGDLTTPQVIDPTTELPDLGEEFWNAPAILIDAGVLNQLGDPIASYPVRIIQSTTPTGLVQKYTDYIRFGVMTFNTYGSATECGYTDSTIAYACDDTTVTDQDGGQVIHHIGDDESALITAINDIQAKDWTPFAEGFYNAIGYFSSDSTRRLNTDDFYITKNPVDAGIPCRPNNILLISDGASTTDRNTTVLAQTDYAGDGDVLCPDYYGSTKATDLSYYGRNYNIFTGVPLAEAPYNKKDYIKTFGVYTGQDDSTATDPCNSYYLMNAIVVNGGTTLYSPQNPEELDAALEAAFRVIALEASSGTAAAVLASGEGSGANLAQAVFYPERTFEGGACSATRATSCVTNSDCPANETCMNKVVWTGTLQNFWYYLDPGLTKSTIREETDYVSGATDYYLDLDVDYIIKFEFDPTEAETYGNLYSSDALGTEGALVATVPVKDLKDLWEAGGMLHKRNLVDDPRTIYTNIDDDSTLDVFDAAAANVTALQPFLNTAVAGDENEAKWIIDYVRGDDGGRCTNDNYLTECDDDTPCASGGGTCEFPRNRTITYEEASGVWKLGDIIHSTPRIVSWFKLNNYDHTYEDQTYHAFVKSSETYQSRGKVIEGEAYGTGMVFTGANDGMLHAFKLGALEMVSSFDNLGRKAAIRGSDLGREEWAFIPKGALPYLKYLMDTDYCHQYYVDATPYIFDASIGKPTTCTTANYWDCDKESTNASWRTVLIGGMRLGGACQDSANASAYGVQTPVDGEGYSSYFALDITDLENPELLWEFSAPGLGFASTGPAIIRINARNAAYANSTDKNRNGRWFAIFASGPTGPIDTMEHQFKGYSDQNLKLFVVDVKDGSLVRTIDTGIANAFSGSLFNAAADYDLDYQDDVIYIGYTKSENAEPTATTRWTEGGVIRLVTGEDRRGTASDWANTALNPDKWVWSHVIENTGSTTAAVTHLTSYSTKKGKTISSGRLFFGTGRYFFNGDDSLSRRRLYGIKEPCLTAVSTSCATDTSLSSYFCSKCLTDTDGGLQVDIGTLTDQTTTVASSADNGWYIDLDNADTEIDAEREITNPMSTPQGAVFFTTFSPTTNPCEFGGLTYVWAVDYSTGGALTDGFIIKGLLQVSTGAIEELSENSFTEAGGRKTLAITGVPPAGQGLTIIMSPPVTNLPLHIRKK